MWHERRLPDDKSSPIGEVTQALLAFEPLYLLNNISLSGTAPDALHFDLWLGHDSMPAFAFMISSYSKVLPEDG
jgi:hypothetical protein